MTEPPRSDLSGELILTVAVLCLLAGAGELYSVIEHGPTAKYLPVLMHLLPSLALSFATAAILVRWSEFVAAVVAAGAVVGVVVWLGLSILAGIN